MKTQKQKQILERLLNSKKALFSTQKVYDRPSRYFCTINLGNGKKRKFESSDLEEFLKEVRQVNDLLGCNLLDY